MRRTRLVLLAVTAVVLAAMASAWLLLRQPPAEDGLLLRFRRQFR
ncbi:MAG: hypothetical protein Q8M01_22085 [Rubrivivax sp.]|nr:hypothetical protein [Rubrivivax sp.]